MKAAIILLAALATVGCAAKPSRPEVSLRDRLVALALGRHTSFAGREFVPVRIEEDSRCPTGVQCIQAGTVRLLVRIEDRSGTRDVILTLGKPVALAGGVWLDLAAACPYPRHPVRIAPKSYLFMLGFRTRTPPPELKLPITCGVAGDEDHPRPAAPH